MPAVPIPPPAPRFSPKAAAYAARIAFVSELAERLHGYGTTAQRLEAAIIAVAQQLGLDCEPWSNPTGIILSFSDPSRPPGETDSTRVIRLGPSDTDLYKLGEADRIAEAVMAGDMDLAEGHAGLLALDRPPSRRADAWQVAGYGLASASVAGLLRLPWLDIATAAATGLLIGLLQLFVRERPRTKEASDAISGIIAGGVALLAATLVAPINFNTVIIASLIVLLPGMALTNAMNELTSQHLVSGTARFAGALASLMKLTVGTMLAVTVAALLGIEPQVQASRPQPDWVEWVALLLAAFAFAVLFRANRRDYPWVMLAAISGYLISRAAGEAWGSPVGVFLSALVLTAAGNAYGRFANRPGAIVRVPGVILLVPGSASLRGVISLFQQQQLSAGQDALIAVMNILLALVAGLLFGNLLWPTRRNL